MKKKRPKTPRDQFPILFEAVQMHRIFEDSKTFADAVPKKSVQKINSLYLLNKEKANFDLKNFVEENFEIPFHKELRIQKTDNLRLHLNHLWKLLKRKDKPHAKKGSLLPLPFPYVVPGGRFNEVYYWDSYFTMMGLLIAGKRKWAIHMLNNFSFLLEKYGRIPNGNRSYYLSRSQPPFYALMVDLLSKNSTQPQAFALKYKKSILREYSFWMKGSSRLTEEKKAHKRVVRILPSLVLNRYWDERPDPREESFREDRDLAKKQATDPKNLFIDVKAACESGWDFSSRWFPNQNCDLPIQTTDILPLDLNCLLAFYEKILASLFQLKGEKKKCKHFLNLYEKRKKAINTYFWNEEGGYYTDWNWRENKPTQSKNLAMAFPLWLQLAPEDKAQKTAKILKEEFLCYGGLRTTTVNSGEQWDAPNGWAPLQWVAIEGLGFYKQKKLAKDIATRWLSLNEKIFKETGKMMEKYNVEDKDCLGGGGEYPVQDGFGWTNGVYLALSALYGGESFQRL
jgi:alpha,alpha-trehalase